MIFGMNVMLFLSCRCTRSWESNHGESFCSFSFPSQGLCQTVLGLLQGKSVTESFVNMVGSEPQDGFRHFVVWFINSVLLDLGKLHILGQSLIEHGPLVRLTQVG